MLTVRCLALVALLTGLAHALADVRCRLEAGFVGQANPERPLNVNVTLENNGPSIDGELILREVQRDPFSNLHSRMTTETSTRLSLVTGARKRFSLQLPVTRGWRWNAPEFFVIVRARDRELLRERVESTWLTASGAVAIVSSDERAHDFVLRGMWSSALWSTFRRFDLAALDVAFTVSPAQVPRLLWPYDQLDGLAINDQDLTALDRARSDTLRRWVEAGGRLFIFCSPRPDVFNWRAWSDTLPVTFTARTQLLPELSRCLTTLTETSFTTRDLVIPTMSPTSGALVLFSCGAPLVVQRPLGLGSTTVVALDLTKLPLREWDGVGRLWQTITHQGSIPINASRRNYVELYGVPPPPVQELFPVRSSFLPLVMFVMSAHLLSLSFLVFKRFRDRERGWQRIIVGSLAFVPLAIGATHWGLAVAPRIVTESVVLGAAGSHVTESRVALHALSPSRRRLSLALPPQAANIGPLGDYLGYSYSYRYSYRWLTDSLWTVRGGEDGKWRAEKEVWPFTVSSLSYFERGESTGTIEARALIGHGTATVFVCNGTTSRLTHGGIIHQGEVHKLRNLDAGENTSITFNTPLPTASLANNRMINNSDGVPLPFPISYEDHRFLLCARSGAASVDLPNSSRMVSLEVPVEADARGFEMLMPLRRSYRVDPEGTTVPALPKPSNFAQAMRAMQNYRKYRNQPHEEVLESRPAAIITKPVTRMELIALACPKPDALQAYNWRTRRWERVAVKVSTNPVAFLLSPEFLLTPPGLARVRAQVPGNRNESISLWLKVYHQDATHGESAFRP